MADSESSSDELYIGDIQARVDSLQGYQFEPRRDDIGRDTDESEEGEQTESASDEEITATSGLVGVDWCSCGYCSVAFLSSACYHKQSRCRRCRYRYL